jgi:addiction module HigA family antidote
MRHSHERAKSGQLGVKAGAARAASLLDLAAIHSNRLETLIADRKGQHSIRINQQWRICFVWTASGAENVEIVDYHWERKTMASKKLTPVHPGEILLEEMEERRVTINSLARALRVPVSRIDEIVKSRRAVTAETALRLARYFGTSAQLWLNLQTGYDLAVAQDKLAGTIEREVLPHSA